MSISRMDHRNRVQVPVEVLDALGLKPGDRMAYAIGAESVVVRAALPTPPKKSLGREDTRRSDDVLDFTE